MKILITGGIKSGKSRRALELAQAWPQPVCFIATACALDDEMRQRIKNHQAERATLGWNTIEEPLELHQAALQADSPLLVDCIPMWVNNLFYYKRQADFEMMLAGFLDAVSAKKHCAIVTNETGLGNIPFDRETRQYNLLLAEANRRIAGVVESLELMVCGIPVKVK